MKERKSEKESPITTTSGRSIFQTPNIFPSNRGFPASKNPQIPLAATKLLAEQHNLIFEHASYFLASKQVKRAISSSNAQIIRHFFRLSLQSRVSFIRSDVSRYILPRNSSDLHRHTSLPMVLYHVCTFLSPLSLTILFNLSFFLPFSSSSFFPSFGLDSD